MENIEQYALEKEIERENNDLKRNEIAIGVEKQNYADYLKESLHNFTQPTVVIERLDVQPWHKKLWLKFKSLF